MDDGLLGRNNGTVDGVRYFDTAGGGMTALFVQRGRLSEANRTRDTMDLGALRARSVGSPVNIGGLSSRLGPIPRDSASLSPEMLSPERTTTRRMRTKSSINPREIEQATNDRRKEKLIQKRARNRTSLNPGAPPSPGSSSRISDDVAHHVSAVEECGPLGEKGLGLKKSHAFLDLINGLFIQFLSALVFFLAAGLLGVQVRESEMRGEIMRLQKGSVEAE